MTVREFLWLCIDDSMLTVTLYDLITNDNVYIGSAEDIPDKYIDCCVQSFDVPTKEYEITLNIESGDGIEEDFT